MIVFKRVSLFLLIFGFTCLVNAQSIKSKEGRDFFHKIGDNLYEPLPAGVISYKIDDNKFWELVNGELLADKPKGYIKYAGDKVYYFNNNDEAVGYFLPEKKRYYIVSSSLDKEDDYARIFENILYLGNGDVSYFVDKGLDPIVIGFFLFIH